jgi:thiamine-phosphate diphosphorylase
VDSAEWVRRVAEYGATTIQLRIKEPSQDAINTAIQQAVKTAREYDVRLFINDYWQAAIQHGAYGVHLGQDDLDSADLHAIARAGLRLGTSTHNYYELARVNSCNPSYIAIGTVFASPSKPGLKSPLGLSELARLAAISPQPVVAIGGLHPENATAVSACGAAGLAVISDIRDAADPRQRMADWIDQLSSSSRTTRPSVSSE